MAQRYKELDIGAVLQFLSQNDWIHKTQVKDIFKKQTLLNMSSEWLGHLLCLKNKELNDLPFKDLENLPKSSDFPLSLQEFINKSQEFSLRGEPLLDMPVKRLDMHNCQGMNPKKIHEVSQMAPFIDELVQKTNCDLVVDIGSGLGYLDHVLHQSYGLKVLGLEVNESHISSAEKRAMKQGLSCSSLKSVKFEITCDSNCSQRFEDLIQHVSPTLLSRCGHTESHNDKTALPNVCLIGLHCCGDLTPAMLHLFHSISCIKALCLVSCCYHKMAYSIAFVNFPMSLAINKLLCIEPSWQISPCTLRLGAQQTRSSWRTQSPEDHLNHTRHVAFRALVELIVDEKSAHVRKRFRKCDFSSFSSFLDSFFPLSENTEQVLKHRAELTKLFEMYQKEINLIEVFTCLQVMLQPVVEMLIYQDRVMWLEEKGYTNVKIKALFDDKISPRNLAIVVEKT